MPKFARKSTGDIVRAGEVRIGEAGDVFNCITENCDARMSIVNVGNIEKAFFRRLPSSPHHISSHCARCGLEFDDNRYDEQRFVREDAFRWLFRQPIPRPNQPEGENHRRNGEGGERVIRTLKSIYTMCINHEKNDLYNGYEIGSFFADEENYEQYRNHLEGCVIVECSYYRKVYNEPALLFNYPTNYRNPHIIIRVNFEDADVCNKYYNKYRGCHHTEPIVIAGNWEYLGEESDIQAQCQFCSDRQIYFVR